MQNSNHRTSNIPKLIVSGFILTNLLSGTTSTAIAQISGDGTLPVPTRVTQSGNSFTITNGTQSGSNLFHSFEQFSVPTGGSAVFNTSQYSGIQNIFSRVTGGNISNINGRLQITPTGANLFLLNPNGILFGPNAELDLGGSLLATTGSSIRFADGTEFRANSQTQPVLTMSVPIGVQFGNSPGSIRVSGSNLSTPNQTLGLLGGDVSTEWGTNGLASRNIVQAPSGRLELGSVAGNSYVPLNLVAQGFTLDYSQVKAFQDIRLLQTSSLTATSGGSIQVQGRQVQIAGGSQLSVSNSNDSLPGGTLIVNGTESVEISGTGDTTFGEIPSGLFNRNRSSQPAGTISINTKTLRVTNGGQIAAETYSSQQGGNITINASEIDVSGVSGSNFSNISVASYSDTTGGAGNILLNAGLLQVRDGGQIGASTFGNGQGGNLTINAATILLSGGSRSQVNGLFAQAGSSVAENNQPGATGQGGNLTINTGSLSVQTGSRISTGTFTAGSAGNLAINADSVQVIGRSLADASPSLITASSTSAGAAGSLAISAREVLVQDGGQVTVSGTGTGVAGNMQITAPFILLDNQGVLLAETKAGQGNITLNTSDLRLRRNSLISTNATGAATGGNITISTQTLVALENSDITANAEESFGGRVSIRAVAIFGTQFRSLLTSDSDITATSALGPDFSGSVLLQTPGIDPSQGLLQLQSEVVDVSRLVVEACSPNGQQATGEFFRTGRGGLPASPSDAASDDRILVDLGTPADTRPNTNTDTTSSQPPLAATKPNRDRLTNDAPLLQAQGWIVNEAGKVVLVAQSSTAAPKVSTLLLPPCTK